MFKSLRWRLQIWHAIILLLAVVGFGAVLYAEIRKARYDEIDGELLAAARTLDGALRAVPRPILQNGFRNPPPQDGNPQLQDGPPQNRPPGDGPPRDDQRFGNGPPPRDGRPPLLDRLFGPDPQRRPDDRPDPNRPPEADRGPEGPPRGDGQRPPQVRGMPPDQIRRMLTLPQSFVERFTEGNRGPYFTVQAANNDLIKSEAVPDELPLPVRLPLRPDVDYRAQQRGQYREVIVEGPEHTRILVGRSIGRETAELNRLFWQLIVTGLGVFATGLVGGWWLSSRAVKPIEKMSATAASISARNLSQRIDVADIDSELAALGRVLNAMFDRLQSSFEQQMRFTADASHELRTPLSVVLTHTELALNRMRTPEDYRDALETCLRAAQRMKLLVDDLLVLARADAGKLELRQMQIDAKQLLQDSAALLEPLAEERGVSIAVQGESAIVVGDPNRLAQVITNLLTNAILYNVEDGRVCAQTSTVRGEVVIAVTDTGVGISPSDLPHLFERFYRVDRARSRSTGGSGLGLAISKTIVEAHGGTIAVSNNPDGGTIFTVRLPAVVESSPRGEGRVRGAAIEDESQPIGLHGA